MFSSSASKLASQATQGAIKIGGIATQKVSDITTDLSSKVSCMLFYYLKLEVALNLHVKFGHVYLKEWVTVLCKIIGKIRNNKVLLFMMGHQCEIHECIIFSIK